VLGDWAYLRNFIDLVITPKDGGRPIKRSGYTLTMLRKENGRWLLARDANLMLPGGG
jgi:ketosteroid isomerase-like protein